MSYITNVLIGSILLTPFFLVMFIVFRKLKKIQSFSKDPIGEENFKRVPGQSLNEKSQVIYEDLMEVLLSLLFYCIICFSIFMSKESDKKTFFIVLLITIIPYSIWIARKAWKKSIKLRNYKLGYKGELFVAQCLEPLIKQDYTIFHDICFKDFNIDHVVVGPTGVYCIETKTRRRPKATDDKFEYRVKYDGQSLQYPNWSDTHGLEQVKNNSRTLRNLLRKEMDIDIPVYSILALPGWFVESTTNNSIVNVVNPKSLPQALKYFKNANIPNDQLKMIHFVLSKI